MRAKLLRILRRHRIICGPGLSATELAHKINESPASVSSLLCKMAKANTIQRFHINGTWRYSK